MATPMVRNIHIKANEKHNDFCLDRRNGDQNVTEQVHWKWQKNDFCLDRRNGERWKWRPKSSGTTTLKLIKETISASTEEMTSQKLANWYIERDQKNRRSLIWQKKCNVDWLTAQWTQRGSINLAVRGSTSPPLTQFRFVLSSSPEFNSSTALCKYPTGQPSPDGVLDSFCSIWNICLQCPQLVQEC